MYVFSQRSRVTESNVRVKLAEEAPLVSLISRRSVSLAKWRANLIEEIYDGRVLSSTYVTCLHRRTFSIPLYATSASPHSPSERMPRDAGSDGRELSKSR